MDDYLKMKKRYLQVKFGGAESKGLSVTAKEFKRGPPIPQPQSQRQQKERWVNTRSGPMIVFDSFQPLQSESKNTEQQQEPHWEYTPSGQPILVFDTPPPPPPQEEVAFDPALVQFAEEFIAHLRSCEQLFRSHR